jgi:DNA polymerase-3 subunit chi
MLPKVNFYILSSQSEQGRQIFACKLAEKAFRFGFKCYILLDNLEQAERLDRLLWTFRANSFVPHVIYQDALPSSHNAVILGTQPTPEYWQHTLINLSIKLPENIEQSEQIFELLDNDPTQKQAGRERYRQYQSLDIDINTYKI